MRQATRWLILNKVSGITRMEWEPTNIVGCKRWGRSDLGITKDGVDRVSIYADQSGNGNDFIQATDSKKFVYYANQIDGHPSLDSDGIDDFMSCAEASFLALANGDDTPFSFYFVFKPILWDTYRRIFNFSKTTLDARISWLIQSPNIFRFERYPEVGISVTAEPAGYADNWYYLIYLFSGTTLSVRINGSLVLDEVAYNADSFDATITSADLAVLRYINSAVQYGKIKYVEDGFYDSRISADNIALLETYLHARYPSI